jgi:hypothetical protein
MTEEIAYYRLVKGTDEIVDEFTASDLDRPERLRDLLINTIRATGHSVRDVGDFRLEIRNSGGDEIRPAFRATEEG